MLSLQSTPRSSTLTDIMVRMWTKTDEANEIETHSPSQSLRVSLGEFFVVQGAPGPCHRVGNSPAGKDPARGRPWRRREQRDQAPLTMVSVELIIRGGKIRVGKSCLRQVLRAECEWIERYGEGLRVLLTDPCTLAQTLVGCAARAARVYWAGLAHIKPKA